MKTATMAEQGRMVVAHFLDGRLLKGTIHDFAPNKECFHLYVGGDERSEATAVRAGALKALFFVRSYEGEADRHRSYSFQDATAQGRRVKVRFTDGEEVAGFTVGYSKEKQGFFLIPADPAGNNTRVFVLNAAVAEVSWP